MRSSATRWESARVQVNPNIRHTGWIASPGPPSTAVYSPNALFCYMQSHFSCKSHRSVFWFKTILTPPSFPNVTFSPILGYPVLYLFLELLLFNLFCICLNFLFIFYFYLLIFCFFMRFPIFFFFTFPLFFPARGGEGAFPKI